MNFAGHVPATRRDYFTLTGFDWQWLLIRQGGSLGAELISPPGGRGMSKNLLMA